MENGPYHGLPSYNTESWIDNWQLWSRMIDYQWTFMIDDGPCTNNQCTVKPLNSSSPEHGPTPEYGPSYNYARRVFLTKKNTKSCHPSIVATKVLQKGWLLLRGFTVANYHCLNIYTGLNVVMKLLYISGQTGKHT